MLTIKIVPNMAYLLLANDPSAISETVYLPGFVGNSDDEVGIGLFTCPARVIT